MKALNTFFMWILRYFGWLQILGAAVAALGSIWLNAPEIKILGYTLSKEHIFYAAIIGAATSGLFAFLNQATKSQYIKMLEERYKKKIEMLNGALYQEKTEALRSQLQSIAHSATLNFSTQERICIYSFLSKENNFECSGRFSDHPDYTTFSERERYPLREGVIGKVWREAQHQGRFRDNNFPDGRASKRAWQEYLQREYAIKFRVSKKFRMCQRDMYAEIMRDTKGVAVAVIVFESERSSFLDENAIRTVYNDNKRLAIVTCLERLKEAAFSEADVTGEEPI